METFKVGFKSSTSVADITVPAKDDINKDDEHKLIKDFGSYTTLHGFHFVFDSSTSHRRIIWMCLMIAGFVCLGLQIWLSILKVKANNVVVQRNVEVSSSLPFPAVTICNQNMLRRSKIMGTPVQDFLDQLDFVKMHFGSMEVKEVTVPDLDQVLDEAGHQVSDMISMCTFNGEWCSAKNFTPAMDTFAHGRCFTFNAGENGSPIAYVGGAGKMQGLSLRLNAESNEYYGPFSYDATGFKIAVHEQGVFADVNEGYDISPGFYTSARIRRGKDTLLKAPFPSQCRSRELNNFDRYSHSSCLVECLGETLASKCKCRVLGMVKKGINVTRYCSTKEIKTCILPEYRKSVIRHEASTKCDCPRPCEFISFSLQMSSAYFPSEHLWDSILPLIANLTGLNASVPEQKDKLQNIVRKRFAAVNIFYETLVTDVVEEKEAYDMSAFWSDLGGNMGLFLGCSIMTVCEFIDLIFMLFLNRWRKKKRKETSQEMR